MLWFRLWKETRTEFASRGPADAMNNTTNDGSAQRSTRFGLNRPTAGGWTNGCAGIGASTRAVQVLEPVRAAAARETATSSVTIRIIIERGERRIIEDIDD